MSRSYCTTGQSIADYLRSIADQVERVGEVSETSVTLMIQVSARGDVPYRISSVHALAAALGLEPEMRRLDNGSYHLTDTQDNLTVFGAVPPPPEERREELLAQLAEVNAEIAAKAPKPSQGNGDLDHRIAPAEPERPSQAEVAAAALTPDAPELPAEHRALVHPDPADERVPWMCACGAEFADKDTLAVHVERAAGEPR